MQLIEKQYICQMIRRLLLSLLLVGCLLPLHSQRPKVGLVLGGGGAKGATEVGVLKEIERAGIKIDYIAGTSIGSIVGGLYSVGYRADDLDSLFRTQNWIALLTERDTTLTKRIVKKEDGVTYLFGFPVRRRKSDTATKRRFGLLRGDAVYHFLDSLVANAPIYRQYPSGKRRQKVRQTTSVSSKSRARCKPIPFRCVAFDIRRHQQIVLSDDSLARNMRASMAIPGGFKPVILDSMTLVDGGMINNLPVDVVREMGADVVIAIDLTQNKHDDYQSPLRFLRRLGGMVRWLVERPDFKRYNENRKLADIYINPDLGNYSVTSFSTKSIADMIEIGQKAGRQHFDELRRLAHKRTF